MWRSISSVSSGSSLPPGIVNSERLSKLKKRIIHAVSKDFFSQINWPALQKDFSSKNNRDLRHAYYARFSEKEKDLIKVQWIENMIESQKHILFFDFLQKYFPSNNILNVVKKNFVKEDKTIVKSSHPPLENILIDCK